MVQLCLCFPLFFFFPFFFFLFEVVLVLPVPFLTFDLHCIMSTHPLVCKPCRDRFIVSGSEAIKVFKTVREAHPSDSVGLIAIRTLDEIVQHNSSQSHSNNTCRCSSSVRECERV